jgi:hypothetical protein
LLRLEREQDLTILGVEVLFGGKREAEKRRAILMRVGQAANIYLAVNLLGTHPIITL